MRVLLQASGLPTNKMALHAHFISRVRRNLHLVLCFSPIGDAFRERLRMFPSLVNCCTIDWFARWGEEALTSVAKSFLKETELATLEQSMLIAVVRTVVNLHMTMYDTSAKFYTKLRR
jgi:dynein heavy chain